MAALDWPTVVTFFPNAGFETVPVLVQDLALAFVNTRMAVDMFDGEDGPTTKLARLYLAAHLGLTSLPALGADSDSPAGPVTAEATLGVSRSYAYVQTSINEAIWSTTKYGRAFEQLIRTSSARLPFTV